MEGKGQGKNHERKIIPKTYVENLLHFLPSHGISEGNQERFYFMGAFISNRLANPEDQVVARKDSWGWALAVGFLALVIVLGVAGLGYVEYMELMK